MQIRQSLGEILELPEEMAAKFLEEQNVAPADFNKYINFCNSLSANAPLQCIYCPNVGFMAIEAFNGNSDPEQTERRVSADMDECSGALLVADRDATYSSSGYMCGQENF